MKEETKFKRIKNNKDIEDLKVGDVVKSEFGFMKYHGNYDNMHVFWGRIKGEENNVEEIFELWIDQNQLAPARNGIELKIMKYEEFKWGKPSKIIPYLVRYDKEKKELYEIRDKSLLEVGL